MFAYKRCVVVLSTIMALQNGFVYGAEATQKDVLLELIDVSSENFTIEHAEKVLGDKWVVDSSNPNNLEYTWDNISLSDGIVGTLSIEKEILSEETLIGFSWIDKDTNQQEQCILLNYLLNNYDCCFVDSLTETSRELAIKGNELQDGYHQNIVCIIGEKWSSISYYNANSSYESSLQLADSYTKRLQ